MDNGSVRELAEVGPEAGLSMRGRFFLRNDFESSGLTGLSHTGGVQAAFQSGVAIAVRADGEEASRSRRGFMFESVWPDKWRLDGEWAPDSPAITIIDGDRWLAQTRDGRWRSNFGDPQVQVGNPIKEIVDPSPLQSAEILSSEVATLRGRRTWRIALLGGTSARGQWLVGAHVDRLYLELDAEWRLITRCKGVRNDTSVFEAGVVDLTIGINPNESTFSTDRDEGGAIEAVITDAAFGSMSLDEALNLLPIEVLLPKTLPTGLSMRKRVFVAGDALCLTFVKEQLRNPAVTMWQRAVGPTHEDAADWRPVTLRGRSVDIDEGSRALGVVRVRRIVHGTVAEVAGQQLDDVLDIALALVSTRS